MVYIYFTSCPNQVQHEKQC